MDAVCGRAARDGVPGVFGRGRRVVAAPGFCAVLLLFYALLIAVRIPNIWLKGRFWAEEGAVYFRNARLESWPDALFAVHTGYLNLSASIAGLLAARLVPLEAAPWISTGFALVIQLLPAILLMTSGISWLRDRWALGLALLMLLIPHGSGEVWLNSITSQFHLCLCVALILASPLRGGSIGWLRAAIIVLAPLSGPASTFLAPLFLLRAAIERSWGRAGQGGLLAAMAAVQVLMVFLHPEPARGIGIGPRLLALVIYEKHVLLPLLGFDHASRLTAGLIDMVRGRQSLWPEMLAGVAASGLIATAVVTTRDAFSQWLLAAGALVMAMSYFGALGQHIDLLGISFGDRYAYVPSALFGLVVLALAHTGGLGTRRIATCVTLWIICIGMNDFMWVPPGFSDGSTWSAEVARWRQDHAYNVEFWPNGWRWPIGDNP
jgi:hypothetical protein